MSIPQNNAESTQSFRLIQVQPLLGSFGAEISGVDLKQPFSEDMIDEIRRAWLQHCLIVFRDQQISPADQLAFAQQLGEVDTYPFVKPLPGFPGVIPIIKEPENRVNFGGGWHSDTSYQEKPPMATLLYGIDVPDVGGDTLFANMYLAYNALSPGMRQIVDGLRGLFSSQKVHGEQGYYKNVQHAMEKQTDSQLLGEQFTHPIARTHPETGKKCLYLSPPHILRFRQMKQDESDILLNYLAAFSVRAEFTTRLKWYKGTLAIWDNRCMQHFALNDYPGHRREMNRITLKGDKPF